MGQQVSNQRADDLTRIHGIGGGLEARLNQAGILTYEQLAAQTPEDLAMLLKEMIGMTVKRISKQDWVGQARQYAGESPDEASPDEDALLQEAVPDRQHYETFTLELLLGEDQNVRRTRVFHVQDGTQESWAGWDEERLTAFLAGQAGFALSEETVFKEEGPIEVSVEFAEKPKAPTKLNLADFQVVSIDTRAPAQLLPSDQPFGVVMTLDLSDLPEELLASLSYQAQIYARPLGSQDRSLIASSEAARLVEDLGKIQLEGSGLPEGIYRISADLTVHLSEPEANDRVALPLHSEGSLVQVL